MKKVTTICIALICTFGFAQKKQKFNLNELLKKNKLNSINREAKAIDTAPFDYIKISENKEEGIVWLPIKNFKNGTIQIEMRGKNVFQKSFIGIAFHGQNNENYDAVYCRPFNFFAKDSVRRIHSIQYISHPTYTWKKLREEKNALFEKEIINPPNPDDWFTLTISIKDETIKAYINAEKIPSLEIQKLNNNKSGKVGIFLGDGSGGDFRNMIIVTE